MDLCNNGKLLCDLRKAKGMTQKQVAEKLGVLPKTVSKWETGHGFPDTSLLAGVSEILGVSIDTLLSGALAHNAEEVGNFRKIRFYVCPHCGSIMHGMGECRISCCGKQLEPLRASETNDEHSITVERIENDFYITFDHEMTKEHYISFVSYVSCDRILTVRLYPEQDCSARFPVLYGGKFYFYCSRHGLFQFDERKKTETPPAHPSLTALMSAFSRAYVNEHSNSPVFRDELAQNMFSRDEYRDMENYITSSGNTLPDYVYTNLAPTPLARSRYCEDCLETAILTGTSQYVILGCGLDTFAFRNEHKNIRIFEIDKNSTISDKLARIERAGFSVPENVRFISADLSKESLMSVLEKNGFNKRKKTLFSCLGLLYYLTNEEISELFQSIAGFAANGSTVVFDFADSHLFSSDVPRVKNMLAMAEKSGEPMKSCFGYGELEKMLEKHHFLIYEFLNRDEIQNRYFAECNNEMSAFENVNYAQAVLFGKHR